MNERARDGLLHLAEELDEIAKEGAMSEELEPCPVCGEKMLDAGAAVICLRCDQVWKTKTFNTLARRARIGELVEESCGGTLDGPLKIFPGFGKDDHWTVSLQSYALGVVSVRGDTLLAALENLAKAIGGDDE